MIINSIQNIISQPLFYEAKGFIDNANVYIKLEGLNIAGSIKLKPAIALIEKLEKTSILIPGNSKVICSTSGNLGIALSVICKEKGYPFICVSDINLSPISEKYMRLYGAEIIKIKHKDKNGGYLANRISLINQLIIKDSRCVFVDQYGDIENINAHYNTTAKEIFLALEKIDYLFIGAGTTGTLMGCIKYFREFSPETKIIAVDALGSITFSSTILKRHIPGLGTSLKPKNANLYQPDDIIWVGEKDTLEMCHYILNKYALLLGGSSGTVLSGMRQYRKHFTKKPTIVAISPDFGSCYIDTLYNPIWAKRLH